MARDRYSSREEKAQRARLITSKQSACLLLTGGSRFAEWVLSEWVCMFRSVWLFVFVY